MVIVFAKLAKFLQFEDVKYLTLPSAEAEGYISKIVITSTSREKIVIPSPVISVSLNSLTLVFQDISTTTYIGILGIVLILAIMVWAYRTENDPFTAGAFASGIVGLILGNTELASVGFFLLVAFILYRIVK